MTSPHSPLSALDFHVLVVLTGEDLYGYAIKKAVESQTGGDLSPEIGTLYRVLARLVSTGLVADLGAPVDGETHRGRPRRYYTITPRGREVAQAEATRLHALVDLARGADLLPDPSAG